MTTLEEFKALRAGVVGNPLVITLPLILKTAVHCV